MAVTKVGKSGGASGAIEYLLKEEKNSEKNAEKKPQIIGGSVTTFGTKEEIKKDFADYSKLKPNVKNQVVHFSISLKPGEHLDEEKKVEFSEKLLEKTGFKTDKIPYLIVEHHDKEYEHWHIVAGRITSEATTVKEWKIAERAIAATKELEQQFGLEKVEYKKTKDHQVKRNEYKLMERTEELSVIAEAKIIIDRTLEQKPTTKVFVESLENEGFEVKPNVSEKIGKMSGFSFKKDDIIFKSSAIGKQYSFQNLQTNGLDYNYQRDTEYLIEVKKNESAQKLNHEVGRDQRAETNESIISRQSLEAERAIAGGAGNDGFDENLLEQISRTQSVIENGERTAQRAKQFIEARGAEFDEENRFIGSAESTDIGFGAPESAFECSNTSSDFTNSAAREFIERSDSSFEQSVQANEDNYFDFERDKNRNQESESQQLFERGLFVYGSGSSENTASISAGLQNNQKELFDSRFGADQTNPPSSSTKTQGNNEGIESNQLKFETSTETILKPLDDLLIKQTAQLITESSQNENDLNELRSNLESSETPVLRPALKLTMETPEIEETKQKVEEIEQDYEIERDYGLSL